MDKPRVLNSCIRCRKHKTRCDALIKKPYPCSNCDRKKAKCMLDVISKTPNRANDVVEKLTTEVKLLQSSVDRLIQSKNGLITRLIEDNPSISEIQDVLIDSPTVASPTIESNNISDVCESGKFSINNDSSIPSVSITLADATKYFNNYYENFHQYLPILPESFYQPSNINHIYKDNKLLFWSIVLTSLLSYKQNKLYKNLSKHVKNLIVETCWYNTPRSVYVLTSLLILTTWPIPEDTQEKPIDNISIKYLSLMKNLSLQLGLHRLQFIDEFSHKTNVDVAQESNLNNIIRERIYKFVTINSNYLLINLGLLYLNFNGFQQDYIINKSNTKDLLNPNNDNDDKYINSLLRLSIIQQKLNENLNNNHNVPSKLINLNMFEVILNDMDSVKSPLQQSHLIKLSLEFSRLQLFNYALPSNLGLSRHEYKSYIYKILKSCYNIIDIFSNHPELIVNHLPIHYRFLVDYTLKMMMRIFFSPLLNSIDDYETLKKYFNKLYSMILDNPSRADQKLVKLVRKFHECFNHNLLDLLRYNGTYYLINKFDSHLVSNVNYELIWLVHSFEHHKFKDLPALTWDHFGIKDNTMIDYLDNMSLL